MQNMQVYTGKVLNQEIKRNIDGANNVRMLQVEILEQNDNQEVQQVLFCGEDNAPTKDSIVVILSISNTFKVVIGVQDNIEPEAVAGQRRIYSQDDTGIKALINLMPNGDMLLGGKDRNNIIIKDDGEVNLNGDADNLVSFADLNKALMTFKTEINNALMGLSLALNTHTHSAAGTQTETGVPLHQVSTINLDIESAKVLDVKVK